MTDPATIPPPPPKVEGPGVFDDLLEVLVSPAKVFARRAKGAGAMFLVVAIALGALGYTAKPVLEPIMDAQMAKGMAAAQAANPQMTAEQMATGMAFQRKLYPVYFVAGPAMALFVLGLSVWVFGKIFGAAVTFGSSFGIAALAYVPRIIGGVITDVQAILTSDTSTITNPSQLSIGPARFLDPTTSSAVMLAALMRVDILVIWSTVLLAIAYMSAGKLSKPRAIAAAGTIWLVAGLFAVWGAVRSG